MLGRNGLLLSRESHGQDRKMTWESQVMQEPVQSPLVDGICQSVEGPSMRGQQAEVPSVFCLLMRGVSTHQH
jgi:hypothetical protein